MYDVGVAQVLTSAQLANNSALAPERWHVEPLTEDRHLVAHRDPEAWLKQEAGSASEPRRWADFLNDEVVSQARADFGEAIMTAETLERHPGPLSPRHLQAVATWLRKNP